MKKSRDRKQHEPGSGAAAPSPPAASGGPRPSAAGPAGAPAPAAASASATAGFTPEQLLDLYQALLLPRLIEERMLLLLRQGKLSKWFAGIGQEAIAVGVTRALRDDDWILPMHRNLGVFTARGVDLGRLFRQLFAKCRRSVL